MDQHLAASFYLGYFCLKMFFINAGPTLARTQLPVFNIPLLKYSALREGKQQT
jgi:hypothetical protein